VKHSSTHATEHDRDPGIACRNPTCHTRMRPGEPHCGYCRACYGRWDRADRPDVVPESPAGGQPGWPPRGLAASVAARREDYAWLRSQGVSPQEAAERIGLTLRTVMKPGRGYERCEPALVNEAALCAPAGSCSPQPH
jgi:hypothetical protein